MVHCRNDRKYSLHAKVLLDDQAGAYTIAQNIDENYELTKIKAGNSPVP